MKNSLKRFVYALIVLITGTEFILVNAFDIYYNGTILQLPLDVSFSTLGLLLPLILMIILAVVSQEDRISRNFLVWFCIPFLLAYSIMCCYYTIMSIHQFPTTVAPLTSSGLASFLEPWSESWLSSSLEGMMAGSMFALISIPLAPLLVNLRNRVGQFLFGESVNSHERYADRTGISFEQLLIRCIVLDIFATVFLSLI
jgi:hypothetical protein